MKLKKNIATSQEGFVFNSATGDSFSSNPIGSDILGMLKDENSLQTIIDKIWEKYDVDRAQFEKDLDDFVAQLSDFNLLY